MYDKQRIQQAVEGGHIVCHPFNPERLGSNGLDLTLGHYYYRLETSDEQAVYNPFDREAVERQFIGPFKALPHEQWCATNGLRPLRNIPPNHPIIALKPGERILAHTHEFIGMLPPDVSSIHGRSRWVRNGLAVTLDSTWLESGSINRLTSEIFNFNQRNMIVLPVGEPLAHVVFHASPQKTDEPVVQKQFIRDLDTAIKNWSPSLMLPQSYLDQRSLPIKIEGAVYD